MDDFTQFLWNQVTPEKQEKIRHIVNLRTKHVTIALENIEYSDNINAALRSCEAFGLQDVHIIENKFRYHINSGINKGAAQWLTSHRHNATNNNTIPALQQLKDDGYLLVGTTPHAKNFSINQVPLNQKIALIFGTEETGLSAEALAMCDIKTSIPMSGFTQSFNISVSVAICLYDIINRLHASEINWQLSPEEKQKIILQWLMTMIRGSKVMQQQFGIKQQ